MGFEDLLGVNPWTALFVLINTLVIFFVARKYLFAPVSKMIRDRQQEIDDLYADAQNAKDQANALQNEYQEKLAAAAETGEQIVKDAVARGQSREEEILRQANAQAAALREKAEADIARQKKKAMSDAKNELSDIAVAIAEKVVGSSLEEDKQAALVEQFIDELGDNA